MKFEEVLPLMREGKKAYITSGPLDHWKGKEKYFLEYFSSMEDFKGKHPETKLSMPSDPPKRDFLACFMNNIFQFVEEDEHYNCIRVIPEEETYQEYLEIKEETIRTFEGGNIEVAYAKEEQDEDSIEDMPIVVFDHVNKCVMSQYYRAPIKMHHDFYFYSEVIVGSEWEVFD